MVDATPCYQCPEGCAIQIGEISDELQLIRDFEDTDPEEWTVRQRQAYLALRKSEWIR